MTLIANLLLIIVQKRIKRSWSFSGLATMVRIMLMYYINIFTSKKDWTFMQESAKKHHQTLFD